MTRRPGLGALLLLGAVAFGINKYSKMTDQQKKNLVNKGKKLVNENLGGLGNMFGKRTRTPSMNGTTV
jgi:hypothetical protein